MPSLDIISLANFSKELHSQLTEEGIIREALRLCQKIDNCKAAAIYLVEQANRENDSRILILKDCLGYDKVKGSLEEGYGPDNLKLFIYDLISSNGNKLGLTSWIAINKASILIKVRQEFEKNPYYGVLQINNKPYGKYDEQLWKDKDTCKSLIGVPLFFSNYCLGVLKVESNIEKAFNQNDKAHIEILGSLVGAAINSIRFVKNLASATKLLAVSKNDADILHNIVKQCSILCNAEACSLFLYDNKLDIEEDKEKILLEGLILRADYGHDNNLSHQTGSNGVYVYRKPNKNTTQPGLTWRCFFEHREISKITSSAVKKSTGWGNKLWTSQWHDKNKICHSIYLCPVKEKDSKRPSEISNQNEFPKGTYGVLKVENKKDLVGKVEKKTGFSHQDQFVIKMFADAIAHLLRDSSSYYGKPYSPGEIFGIPVIDFFTSKEKLFKIFPSNNSRAIVSIVSDFFIKMKEKHNDQMTLDEYSNIVTGTSKKIGKIFDIEDIVDKALSRLFRYEVILNQIEQYRHHFVHQWNVFILGIMIIGCNKVIRDCLIDKIDKNEFQVLKEWFIVSIFHDVGLPVEKSNKSFQIFLRDCLHERVDTCSDVFFPYTSFSILPIPKYHKVYLQIQKSLKIFEQDEIAKYVIHLFAHPSSDEDTIHNHSFISASIVGSFLIDKGFQDESLNRILLAILFHEGRVPRKLYEVMKENKPEYAGKARKALSLTNQPLMFLLALCDTIQNWGRPECSGEFFQSKTDTQVKILLQDLTIKDDEIRCILKYSNLPKDWQERWEKIKKGIIIPQTKYWPRDIPSPEIRIYFYDAEGQFDEITFMHSGKK